jgi:hypothetical protein
MTTKPYAAGPPPRDYRLNTDQDANVRWLVDELGRNGLSGYFRRGALMVECDRIGEDGYRAPPDREDDNGPATLRTVGAPEVVGTLALDYRLTRMTQDGDVYGALFPINAANVAVRQLARAPHLRPLRGVTHTPIVRADGSILGDAGYDPVSGFLHLPDVTVPAVPARPSEAQLAGAVALLRAMLTDFAWVGKHEEANFLGVLLTPLLRLVCPPPYKLVVIMARQPGSGKSLLGEIVRTVHGGVLRTEMPHDDAELSKSLTSILSQTTAPVVEFDNVSGTLRSSRLAGLLTSDVYGGRILGSTTEVELPNDRLWVVTGNNLSLGGDLVRRSTWVTIDPGVPNPELRTDFAIPDLRGWVRAHRAELLAALLTLVAAWVAAGRPTPEARSSDSYGAWRAVVGGVLAHAGVPGEFDAADSAQQSIGADDEGWGEFLTALHAVVGEQEFTSSRVVEFLSRPDTLAAQGLPPLADALPEALAEKFERSPRVGQSLGKWLQARDGRWAGSLVCERVQRNQHGSALWRIRSDVSRGN